LIEGAYFDPRPLQKLEEFASTLELTKSTKSGRPETFSLLPHARKFFGNLLGWKREDGTRLYRKAYWSMARKNTKTQNLALLGLDLLLFDEEAQPEIYIAATEVEQAGECYEAARDMVRSNPELDDFLVLTDYRKTIYCPANGGTLQALSSKGKTKHGSNPSALIFDELHAWGPEHQELYDALTTGRGARRQPLRIAITTAGTEENSICGREYAYARRILNGQVKDPTYYTDIYELPKDADWCDESLWHLANPALDKVVSRQFLREERDEALNSPHKQNTFRRLYLNQWTESAEQWIPLHVWDKNAGPVDLDRLRGEVCFGGLDLAAVSDLTAFVLLWPINGEWYIRPWFFLPEEGLAERSRRDGVRYDLWAEQGLIDLTPGNTTDWIYVTDKIQKLAAEFQIRCVAFDRYGARDVATRLQDAGLEVIDWGQGFIDMSPPCKRLELMALSNKLHHGGNQPLRWNIDCCSATQDAAGNIKPVKPDLRKSSKRIDGVVAMAMAAGVCIRMEGEGPSVYENPDTAVM